MADIFLSYKSERRKAVQHMAGILKAFGYSVWFDAGLNTGQDFSAQIETELRAAKAVVTLWCTRSVNSEWVKEEAHLAKQLGTAIPVLIEPVNIPFGFGLSDTIDLTKWDGAPLSPALTRLLMEIGKKVGRKPQGDMQAIQEFEEPWRRYGAPTLAQFALDQDASRKVEALRSLSLKGLTERFSHAQSTMRSTDPAPLRKRPPIWLFGGIAAAVLVLVASIVWLQSGPAPRQGAPARQGAEPEVSRQDVPGQKIGFFIAPDDIQPETLSRSNAVMAQFGRDLVNQFERNGLNSALGQEIAPDRFSRERSKIEVASLGEQHTVDNKPLQVMVTYRLNVELQRIPSAPTLVRPVLKVGAQIFSLKTGRAIAQIEPRTGTLAPVPANCNSSCIAEALAIDMRAAAAEIVRFALERLPKA